MNCCIFLCFPAICPDSVEVSVQQHFMACTTPANTFLEIDLQNEEKNVKTLMNCEWSE